MSKTRESSKNFRVETATPQPVILRTTTTVVHAIKHACFAAELRIPVRVVEQRSSTVVLTLDAIDAAHAVAATCKRDKRYKKLSKKVVDIAA